MGWILITEDSTVEQVQKAHQMIWATVIERIENLKEEEFGSICIDDLKGDNPYYSKCAACEYVFKLYSLDPNNFNCSLCPFDWGDKYCMSPCSPYTEFSKVIRMLRRSKDPAFIPRLIELAKQIRNLPLKKQYQRDILKKKGGESMSTASVSAAMVLEDNAKVISLLRTSFDEGDLYDIFEAVTNGSNVQTKIKILIGAALIDELRSRS